MKKIVLTSVLFCSSFINSFSQEDSLVNESMFIFKQDRSFYLLISYFNSYPSYSPSQLIQNDAISKQLITDKSNYYIENSYPTSFYKIGFERGFLLNKREDKFVNSISFDVSYMSFEQGFKLNYKQETYSDTINTTQGSKIISGSEINQTMKIDRSISSLDFNFNLQTKKIHLFSIFYTKFGCGSGIGYTVSNKIHTENELTKVDFLQENTIRYFTTSDNDYSKTKNTYKFNKKLYSSHSLVFELLAFFDRENNSSMFLRAIPTTLVNYPNSKDKLILPVYQYQFGFGFYLY